LTAEIRSIEQRLAGIARLRRWPQSADERLALSLDLAALEQFAQARAIVEQDARRDPRAAIVVGGVLQDEQMWEQSSRWFRTAVKLLRQRRDAPATADRDYRTPYDALAANARELRQYTQAEALYHEAIRQAPSQAAYFHFQLGRHHQLGGRPAQAMQEFAEAAKLDPAEFGEPAAHLIASLRTGTPACLLAPPAGVETSEASPVGPQR
jgi:tetratricopeptide (TPR) repeat protein